MTKNILITISTVLLSIFCACIDVLIGICISCTTPKNQIAIEQTVDSPQQITIIDLTWSDIECETRYINYPTEGYQYFFYYNGKDYEVSETAYKCLVDRISSPYLIIVNDSTSYLEVYDNP